MKRPITLKIITILHFILFVAFLWFYIWLIPVVYDSSMSIDLEKALVSISTIINGFAFLGLIIKKKFGWFTSVIYFFLITLNTLINFILTLTIDWTKIAAAIIGVTILICLFDEGIINFFDLRFKFMIKRIYYQKLISHFSWQIIIFGIAVIIHSLIAVNYISKYWDGFGYTIGFKLIPEIFDKLWVLTMTWVAVLFIVCNIGAIIGIALRKFWGLLLSCMCLSYSIAGYCYNHVVFMIQIGSFIALNAVLLGILEICTFAYYIHFSLKNVTFDNKFPLTKRYKIGIAITILIGMSFVIIDYIRLIPFLYD